MDVNLSGRQDGHQGDTVVAMKPNPYTLCLEALKAPALTHEEEVAKACAVAKQAARDDLARQPTPQMQLERVA